MSQKEFATQERPVQNRKEKVAKSLEKKNMDINEMVPLPAPKFVNQLPEMPFEYTTSKRLKQM